MGKKKHGSKKNGSKGAPKATKAAAEAEAAAMAEHAAVIPSVAVEKDAATPTVAESSMSDLPQQDAPPAVTVIQRDGRAAEIVKLLKQEPVTSTTPTKIPVAQEKEETKDVEEGLREPVASIVPAILEDEEEQTEGHPEGSDEQVGFEQALVLAKEKPDAKATVETHIDEVQAELDRPLTKEFLQSTRKQQKEQQEQDTDTTGIILVGEEKFLNSTTLINQSADIMHGVLALAFLWPSMIILFFATHAPSLSLPTASFPNDVCPNLRFKLTPTGFASASKSQRFQALQCCPHPIWALLLWPLTLLQFWLAAAGFLVILFEQRRYCSTGMDDAADPTEPEKEPVADANPPFKTSEHAQQLPKGHSPPEAPLTSRAGWCCFLNSLYLRFIAGPFSHFEHLADTFLRRQQAAMQGMPQ